MDEGPIALVERVARRLVSFEPALVFVGGATTSLHITDPAAPPPRATVDVDVIANVYRPR